MLRYTALCGEDTLYIFPDAAQDAERLTAVMDERYRLYETTVYDRTTPDFDKTGVGKYTATDPAARLVGIAYTAGHTAAKSWGSAARPLLGAYTSDDREIIYRHGVGLPPQAWISCTWTGHAIRCMTPTPPGINAPSTAPSRKRPICLKYGRPFPVRRASASCWDPARPVRWASRGQSPEEGGSGLPGICRKIPGSVLLL